MTEILGASKKMTHPALELQANILTTLSSNQALLNTLGGPAVYDYVPKKTPLPYITFGLARHLNWSVGSEAGYEHLLSFDIWSDSDGRKECLTIAEKAELALLDIDTQFGESHLVSFAHQSTDVQRDLKAGLFRARLNYRGVTEPA